MIDSAMKLTSVVVAAAVSLSLAVPAHAHEPGPFDVAQAPAGQPLPKGVTAKGATVEQVWTWTEDDMVTQGVAVFSATEKLQGQRLVDRKLYVQLYLGKPGKLKQVRLVTDGERNCEFDLAAGFVAGSVTVTDEDHDGKAELAFAYDMTCASDVSPQTRKLLVLEGTAKYALRGETRVDVGGGDLVGGAYKADGFGKNAPLLAYAKAQWAALLAK